MRRILVATSLAALITPLDLGGQLDLGRQGDTVRWPMVEVGTRIRVGVADRVPGVPDRRPDWPFPTRVQRLQGTVRAIARDTLYIDLSNTVGRLAIPRVMIQGVAMSLGKPERARSALQAAAVGAAVLALFVPAFVVDPGSHWFGSAGRATAAGAGIGFSAGFLFGLIRPYERWRTAWIPE